MFLFIFESIGTSELILVGIVALVFLGPRKLPQLARKAGKIMAEFRGTANEFKETWAREVNFDEEAKSLNLQELEGNTIPREEALTDPNTPAAPAVAPVDASDLAELKRKAEDLKADLVSESAAEINDKKNWL